LVFALIEMIAYSSALGPWSQERIGEQRPALLEAL